MIIKQISVFLENKNGRLADVTEIFANAKINISALSIGETEAYGIIRMIVDKPEEAAATLKENGLSAKITDVVSIAIPDVPGALHDILKYLSDADIGVSYMYGYSREDIAYMIIRVDDPQKAMEILRINGVEGASPVR